MQVAVDGYRAGEAEREMARRLSARDLPALSDDQRGVAVALGTTPEEYARSIAAGRRSQQRLLKKVESLGRVLQADLNEIAPGASVESVKLRVFQERFEVSVLSHGEVIPLRIAEPLVDELFESGSAEAGQAIRRILKMALPSRTQ